MHQAEVSPLPLQPLAQDILYCLIMQAMAPSQAVFRKTKQGEGEKKGDAMLRMWDGCGGNYVWW